MPTQWTPAPRELDDLELLLNGALDDIDGFRPGDEPGPTGSVTLIVPAATAPPVGEALELTDPEGLPLARMQVCGTWLPEPSDHHTPAAPEVHNDDRIGLVGAVQSLAPAAFGPFRRYHLSPAHVRKRQPGAATLAVPVVAPLDHEAIEAISKAADGAVPLLLAYVGHGSPRGVSPTGLVRATLAAAKLIGRAEVVAVAAARRDDPHVDESFRELVAQSYADEVLLLEQPGAGDPVSAQHLPEPIARIVRHDRPDPAHRGLVVFFTGLSGSGKSTLARALHDVLLEQGQRTVTSLDGDVVRRHLSAGLGFSRADRETNIRRIGWVAAEISRHGGVAICSPIAPFDATRKQVRAMVAAAGGAFVLVHVATPLAECERRDRKGLYARARAGEIPDFTGISSPYEEPDDADLRVDTTGRSIAEVLDEVLATLRAGGWIG